MRIRRRQRQPTATMRQRQAQQHGMQAADLPCLPEQSRPIQPGRCPHETVEIGDPFELVPVVAGAVDAQLQERRCIIQTRAGHMRIELIPDPLEGKSQPQPRLGNVPVNLHPPVPGGMRQANLVG